MLKKIVRKRTIVLMMVIIAIIGCLIWYKGLITNKETPKKARFVGNILMEDENY